MASEITATHVDTPHHIQRSILLQLRQHGPVSYQQLKPDGVEGNAFNYHLRNLKQSKLIMRENELYFLTPTGHLVSDAFSFKNQRLMLRPASYTMLLVTSGDEVLLYEATRQPLKGWMSLPSGKVHYGDSFDQSILREATRRGLTPEYNARVLSPISVRYTQNSAVVLHRPGTLWHLEYSGPCTEKRTDSGASRWRSRQTLLQEPRALPELVIGLERLVSDSHDPIDLDWSLD